MKLRPSLYSDIVRKQVTSSDMLLPYFRNLQSVPLASPLTAEYFAQPIPWTYVSSWTRSKKSWSISKYLDLFNPKDAIPHSVEDKFLAAARLIANPARGMSQAIIDATAGTGIWYIMPSNKNLFNRQIAMVNADRANRAKVSNSVVPDIDASSLWREVIPDSKAALVIPDDVEIVVDDTLYYASGTSDATGAPTDEARVSLAASDVRGSAVEDWTPLRPSIPFIYGVPAVAMLQANFIRPQRTGESRGKKGTSAVGDFSSLSGRAIIYQVVDPATNTPTTVMFVLHKMYPRSRPTRFVNWENVDGTCIPVSVDNEVYEAITSKFLQIFDGKLDSGENDTAVSPADMAKKFSEAIYKSALSEYFSSSYWAGSEAFLTAPLATQMSMINEEGDQQFAWFAERWMHPSMLVLPHLSLTHCVLDDALRRDIADAMRYPLMARILPATGDMELCVFFEDKIFMLEKSDIITANASTDPVPSSSSQVVSRDDAPQIDGPSQAGSGTDHKEVASTTKTPESGAQEFSNGQIQGTATIAADLGKDPKSLSVRSSSDDVKAFVGSPKGGDDAEKTAKEAALKAEHNVENVIIQSNATKGKASEQLAADLANEPVPGIVQAPPTSLGGSPEKDTKAEPQPHPSGKPAASDDDKRAKKRYGVIEDGKWADIIEVAEGNAVPDGYVPCGSAKLGDKAE